MTTRSVAFSSNMRGLSSPMQNFPAINLIQLKGRLSFEVESFDKGYLGAKGKIVGVFASGWIYVSMKGMALQDGVEGGLVKVRNLSSEKNFKPGF